MKSSLFIIIITIVAASFCFGQNQSTTTQTGDYNQAVVTQSVNNTATVNQNSSAGNLGQANLITITQVQIGALMNTALVNQGNLSKGYTTKKSTALVNQLGENNDAQIYMHTTRSGQNDESSILQDGKDNTAISYLKSHQSQFEYTFVNQNGFDNYAYQDKDDEREGALLIKQKSFTEDMGNQAFQYTHKDQARTLYIEQVGDKNWSKQDIFKGSYSTIVQYGDENQAEVNTPNSSNNHSTVLQGDVDATGVNKTTDAALFGTSSNNWTYLKQIDGNNSATIVQKGLGNNVVNVHQSAAGSMDIMQDGENNVVMGLDVDPIAASLNGSTLNVDQIGSGNTLHLQQTNGASASVSQDGVTNTVVVVQN